MHNKNIGSFGEMVVINYLESMNYQILDKNFRTKFGEIDIVAKDKSEYVFIEVKTRSSSNYGMPAEAVDNNKIKHIQNTSKIYLYTNKIENEFVRYDVIEVYFVNKTKYYINHLINNFF